MFRKEGFYHCCNSLIIWINTGLFEKFLYLFAILWWMSGNRNIWVCNIADHSLVAMPDKYL